MDRESKVGVILIVIGICIPFAALPFVSGYSKENNIFQNLYQVEIVLSGEKRADTAKAESPAVTDKKPHGRPDFHQLLPRGIPFRFILAITPFLLFAGFIRLDSARRRAREEAEPSHPDSSQGNQDN